MTTTFRPILSLLVVLYLTLTLSPQRLAIAQEGTPPPQQAPTLAIATSTIAADLVHNVAGARLDLRTLVGAGGDPHEYQPTPADLRNLSAASLIFEHGLGLEAWLDRAYAASQSKARRVILSTGIEPRLGDEPGHRGEPDPHVWFDPNLVMVMVGNIRDALTETDPAGSDVYAANAERYLAHLRDLDTWIVEVVSTVPIRQRSLVTTHDTLAYFAQRYGFQVIGVVIPSLATDVEPSAQQIALLVTQIRSARVPAIFPENISDDRLMRRVASEANVRVGPELYTDALGQTGSRGETYLAMMRYNVASIMTALGGRLERN